jgi:hypothetical protein
MKRQSRPAGSRMSVLSWTTGLIEEAGKYTPDRKLARFCDRLTANGS